MRTFSDVLFHQRFAYGFGLAGTGSSIDKEIGEPVIISDNFGGALVTEYPMHKPVQRGAFQVRNRLISGMAHGVLIAEAPKKSGALITAKYALEQNREVFVFIGEDEKAFSGCIALEERCV